MLRNRLSIIAADSFDVFSCDERLAIIFVNESFDSSFRLLAFLKSKKSLMINFNIPTTTAVIAVTRAMIPAVSEKKFCQFISIL